jgi:hypothetical protein
MFADAGVFNSNAMIVMITAMTPSLKDSRRAVPMMPGVAPVDSSLIGYRAMGLAIYRQ